MFSSDIKVYTTKVRIESPLQGLRPGMNAEVTIQVNQLDKVLTVPVMAVLEFGGKDYVTKKVDGRFVQTPVELGLSNEKFVEIKKGAKEGELVAMSPISLMTEEEKRNAFGSTGKAGSPRLVQGRERGGGGHSQGRTRSRAGARHCRCRRSRSKGQGGGQSSGQGRREAGMDGEALRRGENADSSEAVTTKRRRAAQGEGRDD